MSDSEVFRPLFKDFVEPAHRVLTVSLWHFHDHLNATVVNDRSRAEGILGDLRTRSMIAGLEPLACTKIYDALERGTVREEWLGRQVTAAADFADTARFDDLRARRSFLEDWAMPHALALAAVAGFGSNWQEQPIRDLAIGVTLVRRLVALPHDVERNIVFIPTDQLDSEGLSGADLLRGIANDRIRRVLWKETVRARDHLAQSQALLDAMSRSQALVFRRWLLTALELLVIIERRDFDVWSKPVTISGYANLHIGWQSLFGRAAFKR